MWYHVMWCKCGMGESDVGVDVMVVLVWWHVVWYGCGVGIVRVCWCGVVACDEV